MTRRLFWIGAAIMTTLLALWVLWLLREVILYVLISLTLAGAIAPLFRNMGKRRRLARLGMILLYLLALGGFLLFLVEVGGAAFRDIQALVDTLSVQDVWQQPDWVRGAAVQQFLNDRLPPPSVLVTSIVGERGEQLLPILLGITQAVIGILSGTLVIVFLGLYWSTNRTHFEQLWLSLLPPRSRRYTRDTLRTMERDLGRYIRAEFIQSLLVGVLFGLGYWILGSPYPALLAMIGAVASLIPVVGVIIAILAPLLIGLLSSLQVSVFTTILSGLVLLVIKLWLKPRLYRGQQPNPILTIFLLIVLANAFGLLGIIAAPPLAAATQILWDVWVSERTAARNRAAVQTIDIKERQARLAEQIEAMDNPPPVLSSGLQRLSTLVRRSEPVLEGMNEKRPADSGQG